LRLWYMEAMFKALATLKRVFTNIEWPGFIGLWGFLTLAIMALSQGYSVYFVIILAAMGVGMAIIVAHNTFRNKSEVLIDKYEEKFFEKLESKRKSAAQFLLGNNPQGSGELEDILDFLEAPLAQKVIGNYIDAREVYSYFYHWIRLYWQASQNYINDYRKDEPGAWGSIGKLYEYVSVYEKKEIKKDTGKVCTDNDLILTPQKLKKYLKEEAS
jgi:hypothetical protein